MKKCILCGKLFQPTTNAQRTCTDQHYRKCKFCGELFPISRPSDSKQCCSKQCTEQLRQSTMIKRYGVPHALQNKDILEKSETTQLERYGVRHAAQNEDIKHKTQKKFEEKYGVHTPFLMKDFQEKTTKTCLEKYGVSHTSQIPGRTKKMQDTNLKRYGSTYPLGNDKIAEKVRHDMIVKYGVPFYCMTDDCKSKQKQIISSFNRVILSKLSDLNISATPEAICIDRYSYDIHIDNTNVLIEVNPTDTHNAICNPWSDIGLDRYYHTNKSKLAMDNGYRCIHIWDWDNIDKILNLLVSKQVIYARYCTLRLLTPSQSRNFENLYHLQNSARHQTICLGLYYRDNLVQLMTFGVPRYNKKYEYELIRLCSASNYAVVGGAEKLLKYFINNYDPTSIISYCDLSKFTGDVYVRLNMKLDHITEPNKIWSKGKEFITNNLLLQRGYDQLFNTSHGKGTSNEQLMLDNGWLPVYDCGQAVYTWDR